MVVELNCAFEHGGGLFDPTGIGVDLILEAVGFAEGGIAEGELRIGVNGVVQRVNGLVEIAGLVITLHEAEGFEVQLVRGGRRATAGGAKHFGGYVDVHQAAEAGDGFVLKGREIADAVLEGYNLAEEKFIGTEDKGEAPAAAPAPEAATEPVAAPAAS